MNGSLALRLLWRQWRSGELRLMLVAATLAVATATLLAAFGDRLDRALLHRAAELAGGDLVLQGSKPPGDAVRAAARTQGVALSAATDFSTMLVAGEQILLVSVRAVDEAYPLRGALRGETAPGVAAAGLVPGEVWVEPRVAQEMQLAVGDAVEVGYATLRVGALLMEEPDRSASLQAFSPRVLMRQEDLAAARVIQPGSRVRHRTLFAGDATAIAALRTTLEPQLAPEEELLDAGTGSRRSGSVLARARDFLMLAGALGLLLCGVAIGFAADRHARGLYDSVALLRTFGLARAEVLRLLLVQALALALLAATLGTAVGYALQALLVQLLRDLLPTVLPAPGARAALAGFATALLAIPAFLLPPLLRLSAVTPLRVLRRDLEPPGTASRLGWTAGGLGLAALLLVLASDATLALALLAGAVGAGVPALALAGRIPALLRRTARSLPTRLALDRLARAPWRFGAQALAYALILTVLALSVLLRDDILAEWQLQLPDDAPNVFTLNLLPHEREPFLQRLDALGVAAPRLYPVAPGRLVLIDGEPAGPRAAPGSSAERQLNRDLSLTEAALLPEGNTVSGGTWWPADAPANLVSVEQELADELGIAPGATLTFDLAGEQLTVEVASLREVDWNSFRPNFFMIFSPGTFGERPHTLLTSFHAPDTPRAVRELRGEFPALTLIEVAPVLERLREFTALVGRGIGLMVALLAAGALLLTVAAVRTQLEERLGEAALLRVLGARRALLTRSLLAEFAVLGASAGTLALLATETARALLLTGPLAVSWQPQPWLLLLPLLGAALLAGTGLLLARRSLAADARPLLAE